MKIGDCIHGGIYVGDYGGHYVICSPIEYDLPVDVDWHQASNYCKAIGMELPTKEELNLLYELYKIAPKYFPKREFHGYWSSTECTPTDVWAQFFFNGYQFEDNKASNYRARSIKRIKIDQCN